MSRRIVVRPAADRDLDEQARYIAVKAGLDTALRFYDSADETFRLLLSHPRMGRLTQIANPFLSNTRMFPIRNFTSYLVFYRPRRRGIEIVRVVRGSRDFDGLLES